jgi:hypothetical protein
MDANKVLLRLETHYCNLNIHFKIAAKNTKIHQKKAPDTDWLPQLPDNLNQNPIA